MLSLRSETGDDVVLRLMTREPWRAHGHGLTTRESQIQQMLTNTPVPAPLSHALDAGGENCGYPAHLMSQLPGVVDVDQPEVFEGRRLLIAYYHMWHTGHPAPEQCEGCIFFNGQVRELSYLHCRDVTYATLCQGPYDVSVRYRDFMGWDVPWYSVQDAADALLGDRQRAPAPLVCYLRDDSRVFETYWTSGRGLEAMAPSYGLLDLTVYGRQEPCEDSPTGWPRNRPVDGHQWRINGRPTSQWSRLDAGHDDDLGVPSS